MDEGGDIFGGGYEVTTDDFNPYGYEASADDLFADLWDAEFWGTPADETPLTEDGSGLVPRDDFGGFDGGFDGGGWDQLTPEDVQTNPDAPDSGGGFFSGLLSGVGSFLGGFFSGGGGGGGGSFGGGGGGGTIASGGGSPSAQQAQAQLNAALQANASAAQIAMLRQQLALAQRSSGISTQTLLIVGAAVAAGFYFSRKSPQQ